MPVTVEIESRQIYKEEVKLATTPNPTQETVEVLGLGPTLRTPCDFLVLSNLGQYANDAAAQAAGLNTGDLYWSTSTNRVRVRMS